MKDPGYRRGKYPVYTIICNSCPDFDDGEMCCYRLYAPDPFFVAGPDCRASKVDDDNYYNMLWSES